jgi:hypothetical protein
MVTPHSVIEFGLMRHQELQAEVHQMQRAMATGPSHPVLPDIVSRLKAWVGAALIRLGTALLTNARVPGWDGLTPGS